jgi:hypothetical protein
MQQGRNENVEKLCRIRNYLSYQRPECEKAALGERGFLNVWPGQDS